MFVSSIGIFRRKFYASIVCPVSDKWSVDPSKNGLVPETPITDPHIAMGGGYSESKWVGEAILARAAQQTPLRPIIVRLGQLTGSRNGRWNQREWFPSMVKSAVMGLNCLPNLDGVSFPFCFDGY
jgi:thioester reductase-like protein